MLPNHIAFKERFLNRSDRFWLIAIIAVAILLRVAAAFYLGDRVVNLPGTFDQISYDMLARRVIGGYGFTVAETWWPITPAGEPTAHWSFLYTLYLAAGYKLFGYHPLAARLIQAVLAGVLMPWLTYRLGRRHFDNKVGLVAAGLSAVYLYFVYYAATLMTETFYIIAILWVLDLAGKLGSRGDKGTRRQGDKERGRQKENRTPRTPVTSASSAYSLSEAEGTHYALHTTFSTGLLLGVALAVTVLLRQVFLLFIPVLFLWLLWRSYRRQSRSVLKMMGVLAGTTAILILAILPWTYRNYQVFGRFVLLNTNAGYAFFWGNHPIHGYNFISILPVGGPSYQDLIPTELRDLDEAALDQALLKRSFTFIQSDPVRYTVLSISRIKDYFKFWPSSESSLISNISRIFSFALLLPFMIYGLIVSFRQKGRFRRVLISQTLILYLFMVVYTGIHLLTWALIRYRLPVDALLIIFAAVALVDIRSKLAKRFSHTLF